MDLKKTYWFPAEVTKNVRTYNNFNNNNDNDNNNNYNNHQNNNDYNNNDNNNDIFIYIFFEICIYTYYY